MTRNEKEHSVEFEQNKKTHVIFSYICEENVEKSLTLGWICSRNIENVCLIYVRKNVEQKWCDMIWKKSS